MDLTFGVCSDRVLLAILMVLDEEGHGLPVGQFLFSAKQEAKAVHADYNGKLLEELIGDWQRGMGKNADGEEMDVSVAGTDNDPRERYGLTANFPHILLLLCMFHTWQAWRNGLNKHLRVIPAGDDRQSIRRRLVYEEAVAAYNEELEYFRSLTRRRDNLSKQQGKGGLAFPAYLASYLKLRSFWLSWSLAGAIEAARKMGVAVSEVARTTNALESWNGRLKGKYISHHMHSGRLPRVDHWIFLLITEILPTLFAEWAEKRQRAVYYTSMRQAPTSISDQQFRSRTTTSSADHPVPTPAPPAPLVSPILRKPTNMAEAVHNAQQWASDICAVPRINPDSTLEEELIQQLEEDVNVELEGDEQDESTDEEACRVGFVH
ncbi:hypothetical protein C8J57DRAFT_1532157 [Mycena rebaudengoi]|nr:hypothetical protein C8J57DRAFT_1532157 [Mycena rebaudengoi]